jgi:hypothetical protein
MFLTAMLVRNPVHGWEGVNTLLYEEPGDADSLRLPESPTTRAMIGALDGHVTGARTLLGSSIVVPRGGNAIDAYIDVVIVDAFRSRCSIRSSSAPSWSWSDPRRPRQ